MDPVTDAERTGGAPAGKRIERILCPVDFSEASVKAYRYAQSIAEHYGAALIVQHVVELWQHPSGYYTVSLEPLRAVPLGAHGQCAERIERVHG